MAPASKLHFEWRGWLHCERSLGMSANERSGSRDFTPHIMLRAYDHFYVWGQIEPKSWNKYKIIVIEC